MRNKDKKRTLLGKFNENIKTVKPTQKGGTHAHLKALPTPAPSFEGKPYRTEITNTFKPPFSADSPVDLLVQRNKPERQAYRRAPGSPGRAVPGCLRSRSPLSPSPASRSLRVTLPGKQESGQRLPAPAGMGGHLMEVMSSNKPGVESCDTSGTTISEPVKSHLSPAWADSTASARRITSRLRGMLPRGSSPCVSWMRTWHGQKVQHRARHQI